MFGDPALTLMRPQLRLLPSWHPARMDACALACKSWHIISCHVIDNSAKARGCSMEQAHLSHRVPALLPLGKPTWCGGKSHAIGSSASLLVRGLLGDRKTRTRANPLLDHRCSNKCMCICMTTYIYAYIHIHVYIYKIMYASITTNI